MLGNFDKKVVLAYLGMILATNPAEEQQEFIKDIPLPIRLAYRLVGKGLYRKQYATLFPGRELRPSAEILPRRSTVATSTGPGAVDVD